MSTEIYAWGKLRDLEAEVSESLRHTWSSTGTTFTPKDLIGLARPAMRWRGLRLESWSAAPMFHAHISLEPARPTRG